MRVPGGYGRSAELEIQRLYRDSIQMTIGEATSDSVRTVITNSPVAGNGRVSW